MFFSLKITVRNFDLSERVKLCVNWLYCQIVHLNSVCIKSYIYVLPEECFWRGKFAIKIRC